VSGYEPTDPKHPDYFNELTDGVPSREQQILTELEANR